MIKNVEEATTEEEGDVDDEEYDDIEGEDMDIYLATSPPAPRNMNANHKWSALSPRRRQHNQRHLGVPVFAPVKSVIIFNSI